MSEPVLTVRATVRATAIGAAAVLLTCSGASADAAAGPVPYVVTAIVSTTVIPLGHTLVMPGQVAPKAPGKVTLQELDGLTWRTVERSRLSKKSMFQIAWTPTTPGVYVLRILKDADEHHASGVSNPLTVVVTGLTLAES